MKQIKTKLANGYIVSTVQVFDEYETIVFDGDMEEVDCTHQKSLAAAKRDHEAFCEKYDTATKFKVGECYYTRSACDHECIYAYEVVKRTAKTVTLLDTFGREKRRKVYLYEGVEQVSPEGDYSMAPVLCADRILQGEGTLQERVEAMHKADREIDERERMRLMIQQRMKMSYEAITAGA